MRWYFAFLLAASLGSTAVLAQQAWPVAQRGVLHSVTWFKLHPQEMLRVTQFCREYPSLPHPNDCAAALTARYQ